MGETDLTINSDVRTVMRCTGDLVTVDFLVSNQCVATRSFSRLEASRIGAEIAETGAHEAFPIGGVLTSDVKGFGIVLQRFGKTGN